MEYNVKLDENGEFICSPKYLREPFRVAGLFIDGYHSFSVRVMQLADGTWTFGFQYVLIVEMVSCPMADDRFATMDDAVDAGIKGLYRHIEKVIRKIGTDEDRKFLDKVHKAIDYLDL